MSKQKMITPHPIDIYVGKRLRLRRSMLGMSQEALGKSIGVTFQQVQKYERGVNRVSSSKLYDFAKILQTTVGFFFEDFEAGKKSQSQVVGFSEGTAGFESEEIASKETMNLVRAYNKISDPSVRKRVIGLVKAIASAEDLAEDGSASSLKKVAKK